MQDMPEGIQLESDNYNALSKTIQRDCLVSLCVYSAFHSSLLRIVKLKSLLSGVTEYNEKCSNNTSLYINRYIVVFCSKNMNGIYSNQTS